MRKFSEDIKGIYRLKICFEAIYTSVFLIESPSGPILVDCATTDTDVDTVIVPALKEIGYPLSDIHLLVLTHRHGDHAGGLRRVLEISPEIEVITDIRTICEGIYTYSMTGHTEDCIGVLDERTHTLISGDGLQGAGVDRYRCHLENKKAYLSTLRRIQNDERIKTILFSHAYEPWYRDRIDGRECVLECLEQCENYV